MNVLIACEESQRVCIEFRKLGHRAFSCDIQGCSGGHPEWHIQGDVLAVLNGKCKFTTADTHTHTQTDRWDLVIAHPPCTFISNAGARHLYPEGKLNNKRLKKGIAAVEFFMKFYEADCDHIAIENPIPSTVYNLPQYDQVIEPWMFGHPVQKKTCLWLKNLPNLMPTDVCEERQSSKIPGN